MALELESEAVNGPTTGGGVLPPFEWDRVPVAPGGGSAKESEPLHLGQPHRFDFKFETMSPDPLIAFAADGCGHERRRGDGEGLLAW